MPKGPVLDLSGPRLRRAFEDLAQSAEPSGGVERYVTGLALKASLFQEVLGKGADQMTETEFLDLVAFMAPVRRRISAILEERGFDWIRTLVARLLSDADDTARTDARMAAFLLAFPDGKEFRWVRDLAAELLHFTWPEAYPLMTRWVWDSRVETGVLREIWHADDVDTAKITAPSDFATYSMLHSELDGFLADQGVFRDRIWYVDLLLSHVYAGYINDRGGQYLRNDFTIEGDPMQHTRRMLGLDAVNTENGRTRLRLIDGTAHVFGGSGALQAEEALDAHP